MPVRSLLAAAALALFPTIAQAQITPPSSGDVDPAEIVRILQALGNTAKVQLDKDGEPEIEGKTQNINFLIFFYNCQKQAQPVRCRSYQFWASFHDLNPQPTLDQLNRWNETKRLAQASTDGQGRYRLKMNVNPKGADVDVNFRAYMDWWNLALKEYMAYIGFRK